MNVLKIIIFTNDYFVCITPCIYCTWRLPCGHFVPCMIHIKEIKFILHLVYTFNVPINFSTAVVCVERIGIPIKEYLSLNRPYLNYYS